MMHKRQHPERARAMEMNEDRGASKREAMWMYIQEQHQANAREKRNGSSSSRRRKRGDKREERMQGWGREGCISIILPRLYKFSFFHLTLVPLHTIGEALVDQLFPSYALIFYLYSSSLYSFLYRSALCTHIEALYYAPLFSTERISQRLFLVTGASPITIPFPCTAHATLQHTPSPIHLHHSHSSFPLHYHILSSLHSYLERLAIAAWSKVTKHFFPLGFFLFFFGGVSGAGVFVQLEPSLGSCIRLHLQYMKVNK